MVYGVEKFKEAFAVFQDSYVVIGGTACDAVLAGSRIRARATDDIDMKVNTKDITKHRNDVLKLAAIITPGPYSCSEGIFLTIKIMLSIFVRCCPAKLYGMPLALGMMK